MRCLRRIEATAVVLALWGLVLPPPCVQAAETGTSSAKPPATAVTAALDVVLQSGGTLQGQVVNGQGAVQPGKGVVVLRGGQAVGTVQTDDAGRFSVGSLRGGVYQVTAAGGARTVRAWSPGTAPPGAQPAVLVVSGDGVLRGQLHPIAYLVSDPWFIAAMVTAAITIPVAIHNYRGDRPPSS